MLLNTKLALYTGKIIATVHPENKSSQSVLQKLGLTPDPEKQNVPKYGTVRNYYQRQLEQEENC